MFDFLFRDNKARENVVRLSKEVDSLNKELNEVKEDLDKIKISLTELQMSLTLVLGATQGVADDLAVLYTTVFGSEQKKISALSFTMTKTDDEDYEN